MRRAPALMALLAVLALPAGAAVEANTASQADLETVKGIGPALSDRIMAARRERPFSDWADFARRVGGGAAARLGAAGVTVNGARQGAPSAAGQTPASASAPSSAARSASSL